MSETSPLGMSPDELLEMCGPSWAAMTPDQRERYAHPDVVAAERAAAAATTSTITTEDVRDLLTVALDFKQTIARHGLSYVAIRWARTEGAIALAAQLDWPPEVPESRSPAHATPIRSLAMMPSRQPRSLRRVG